jgi:FkbM family methyltransferase
MDALRWQSVKTVVRRNRPSQKPQLWENFPLALTRRLEFELSRRVNDGWLDRERTIRLSQVGFHDDGAPLRMKVIPRQVISKSLFLYGLFEISETRLVQSVLRPGMAFVDIGANIGYYSLIAARLVGPTGLVHSFEPNDAVRARFSQNIQMNGFANVTVDDRAVTRESGAIDFYLSAWNENDGISSTVPNAGLSQTAVRVPCISLDDFAASLGGRQIDLLKIDVEGAELGVLEGGRRVLGAPKGPALLFESFDFRAIGTVLEGFGYHVRRLDYTLGGGLELRTLDDSRESLFSTYEAPNFIAVKDPRSFDEIMERANDKRSPALRWLGRV